MRKKTKGWWLTLVGLIVSFVGAILLYYALGAHPCTKNSNNMCAGETAGFSIAYVKAPKAAHWGFIFLLLGFGAQGAGHLISKK